MEGATQDQQHLVGQGSELAALDYHQSLPLLTHGDAWCLQTQLADFWWFEHLLSLPSASDEVVNHFGALFPFREVEHAALPAPVAARMFLRHIRRNMTTVSDWDTLLQLLGLLRTLSQKQQQFRSAAAATALNPPTELVTEVSGLLHHLALQQNSSS